jgi:hypothetical protein
MSYAKQTNNNGYNYELFKDRDLTDTIQPHTKLKSSSSGFQVIATSVYGGTEWHVLLWDWENSPPCAITPGKG